MPPLEIAPSPSAHKPVAEIKLEQAPTPKPRTPRNMRLERASTNVEKKVLLSTVSMQNKNKTETSAENGGGPYPLEASVSGSKFGGRSPVIQNNMQKVERSRTTMSGNRERDLRKNKYSGSVYNKGEHDLQESAKVKERSRPNTNDRGDTAFSHQSVSKTKVEVESNHQSSSRHHFAEAIDPDKMTFGFTSASLKEKSSKSQRSGSDRHARPKEPVLPKPSPPSQQYLLDSSQGQGQSPSDSPWGHRSTSSPKAEMEWLSQVKRFVFVCDLYPLYPIICINLT